MKRAVIIYSVALVGSLFAAYRVWTRPPQPELGDQVVVLAGDPDELERLHFRSTKLDLTLDMKKDELGKYAWVRVEPLGAPEAETPEDPDNPDNPHAPPKDDGAIAEFKAGKSADAALKGLMPFVAKRSLDGLTDDKLAELGLAEPDATLEIQRTGREPKVYEVGGNVYGGANVYVRDPETGKVYVVDSKVIRPLQGAKQSLPDRDLVGVETRMVTHLAVKGGEATAEFDQHNPDDAEAVFWSTAGESTANATAAGWIDKALRMRSSNYVQQGDDPGNLETVYAFAVRTTDRKTIEVTVMRGYDENGDDVWYANSTYTRGLVKLQRALAAEVATELPTVLDAGS
jgi:hypothetical protein